MSAMRFAFHAREQKNASLFCVCCLRVPRQRGFGRSDKCTKGRTGPVSLWYEWCSKAAVSRNPKRPAAALGYGRCRGGIESSPFMMRRTSTLGTSEFIALRMAEEIYVENGESACFSTMVSAELSLITSKRFCALLV